ncbi:SDR family NAD(P)-dependent oxidoreductase [Frankia sp. CNm7]|uniref:SDR family NAD(P)-dependent oxidoreductase n=1 Tax=Frankia nepalensis TaxID=1836974 RepID=A0A937UL36_9ACTN|nr:SDR family NAD(P)-dependent oxidoreductase [Frankia nepalensis]MBL7496694.1 SDR family NAD(P)-dependent oxidoreductase [Frankia nepalensis]MBL7511076.1 SDR family NAD(P)-dependent oxidoreductase [Frankia nepalensis]MBL7516702.1 SDR family NAD(P)-dependent oxidoreductase [Frankia nepalensis]MBL7627434.1 SDR family NAD(P)-dependent oxidoreductase [Frankia nepalensis]
MQDLEGKVAVITGSGGPHGIGRATARAFAGQGCKVVLSDIDATALADAVEELRALGHDVLGVPTNVADFDSVRQLADAAYERYGQVDILYLNAGVAGGGGLFDDETSDWRRVYDINLFGILHGIKAFAPRMIAQGTPGHILAASSGSGAVGVMYQTPAYSTSKQAVCTLMECLHGQLRDKQSLIKAHVALPPLTKTNLAGDRDIMTFVQQGLEAGGVAVVLAEPEEVATTILETVRSGNFWAHHDHEADKRLYDGRFAADIDWQDEMIRRRATAIIDRSDPDPYLWGM